MVVEGEVRRLVVDVCLQSNRGEMDSVVDGRFVRC